MDRVVGALVELGRNRPIPYLAVCGVAGVGRTAFLLHAANEAAQRSFPVAMVTWAPPDLNDPRETVLGLARAVAESLAPVSRLLVQRRPGSSAVQRLRQILDATRTEGAAPLRQLFPTLGEAAEQVHLGLVVVIDDVHRYPRKAVDDLLDAAIDVRHRSAPLLVLMGIELGTLADRVAADTTRQRSELIMLGPLDTDAMEELLTNPSGGATVAWDENALRALTVLSKGYPSLALVYARHAWQHCAQTSTGPVEVTMDDVVATRAAAEAELANDFYKTRLEHLTAPQRRMVEAISELGGVAVEPTSLTRRLGLGSRLGGGGADAQVNQLAEPLVNGSLLYRDDAGRLTLTVPRPEIYLRRSGET